MKRGANHVLHEHNSHTPGLGLRGKPPPHSGTTHGKRHKQTSMYHFLDSATAVDQDTPALFPRANHPEWPTTAQRALENFTLDTPIAGLAEAQAPPIAQPQPPPDAYTQPVQSSLVSAATLLDDEYEYDDFRISMSQTYQRSQADPAYRSPDKGKENEEEEEEYSPQQQSECELERGPSTSSRPFRLRPSQRNDSYTLEPQESQPEFPGTTPPPLAGPSGSGSSLPKQDQHPAPAYSQGGSQHNLHNQQPLQLPALSNGPAVTPEFSGQCADTKDDGSTPQPQVEGTSEAQAQASGLKPFGIFLPKSLRKSIVLIRHGESEYNLAVSRGKGFADPMIFDPDLTPMGRLQALHKRAEVAAMMEKNPEEVLWVLSPLTRAIQTFLELCPQQDRLPRAGAHPVHNPVKVVITPLHSEFMVTAGDVGRPASELAAAFPQFAPQLAEIPELWWYRDEANPSCAMGKHFGAPEPSYSRLDRVAQFRRWLRNRPERFIIAIGHCSFWHKFLGPDSTRMRNCEHRTLTW